jgi:hypothetical protein
MLADAVFCWQQTGRAARCAAPVIAFPCLVPLLPVQGCVLLFSHCWPQGASEAHSHPLWQLAERLGAEVAQEYDPARITHVVSVRPQV